MFILPDSGDGLGLDTNPFVIPSQDKVIIVTDEDRRLAQKQPRKVQRPDSIRKNLFPKEESKEFSIPQCVVLIVTILSMGWTKGEPVGS